MKRASQFRHGCADLLFLQGLLWRRILPQADVAFGIKPGTPVLTTGFSRCLI